MPLNSIADIQISLSALPSSRPNFGVPALFALLTSPQNTAFGADRCVELRADDYLDVLASLGITAGEDAYVACQTLFSQTRTVDYALLCRRETPVAQVYTITITGTTDGTYTASLNGTVYSYAATGDTVEQIRDGLSAAIGTPAGLTVADVSTDEITVTAADAGLSFTASVDGPAITGAISTPNTGIDGDIALAIAERNDFYAIAEVGHTDPAILQASRYIAGIGDSNPKLFFAQSNTADILVGSSTTDVADVLKTEGSIRTALVYSANDDQFVEVAWMGRMLPATPGAENWAYQDVTVVTGFAPTSTQEAVLLDKRVNWLESFSALDVSTMRHGITAGGQYLDIVRGRDSLRANLQIDYFDALRANAKIPYTDEGGQILGAIAEGRLQLEAANGFVVADSIVVNVPLRVSQSAGNVALRRFAGITFSAQLQGAVNSVEVQGALLP